MTSTSKSAFRYPARGGVTDPAAPPSEFNAEGDDEPPAQSAYEIV
jgi:hypothetical protein